MALPVLRLTGLFLALATLAFASIMDKVIFQADWAFGFNGLLPAGRLSLLGHTVSSTGGYVFLMAVFLVLVALGGAAAPPRRRRPAAHRHPRQCRCLRDARPRHPRVPGRPVRASRPGSRGSAGALFAGLRQNIGAGDFIYFNSLLLLLFAVVSGSPR